MTKRVSPTFAAIVIVVALVLGVLYFMARLRAHERQQAALAAAAQAQADAARRSGRLGRAMGSRSRRSVRRGGEAPQGTAGAPGDQPAGEAAGE